MTEMERHWFTGYPIVPPGQWARCCNNSSLDIISFDVHERMDMHIGQYLVLECPTCYTRYLKERKKKSK